MLLSLIRIKNHVIKTIENKHSEKKLTLRDGEIIGSMKKYGQTLRDSMDRLTASRASHVSVNTCYKNADRVFLRINGCSWRKESYWSRPHCSTLVGCAACAAASSRTCSRSDTSRSISFRFRELDAQDRLSLPTERPTE